MIEKIKYIGDGVYVETLNHGLGLNLMANDHLNPTDTIFLEPEVAKELVILINNFLNIDEGVETHE